MSAELTDNGLLTAAWNGTDRPMQLYGKTTDLRRVNSVFFRLYKVINLV